MLIVEFISTFFYQFQPLTPANLLKSERLALVGLFRLDWRFFGIAARSFLTPYKPLSIDD